MSELPFDIVTPNGWAAALDAWPWSWLKDDQGHPIGAEKRGPCPNCGHGMSVSLGITEGITDLPSHTDVSCNCAVKHAEGQTGCGAHGEIGVPTP